MSRGLHTRCAFSAAERFLRQPALARLDRFFLSRIALHATRFSCTIILLLPNTRLGILL